MKNVQVEGLSWNDQFLAEFENDLNQMDVPRAPMPPATPEQATILPIYLKNISIGQPDDIHIFGFWENKWARIGDMGGPTDWRPYAGMDKKNLQETMSKK